MEENEKGFQHIKQLKTSPVLPPKLRGTQVPAAAFHRVPGHYSRTCVGRAPASYAGLGRACGSRPRRGCGREPAAGRAVSWKAPGPRLRTAPSISTFAFRFLVNPASSRSQTISPKARGAALLSSRVPPATRGASYFGNLSNSLTDCTSPSVPHPGRAWAALLKV